MSEDFDTNALTLDPPGSIAVVGAGPLGIEAALYGRYLGYDVTLIEANSVANSFRDRADKPLPMLPNVSLSPLAISALTAQYPDWATRTRPTTIGAWIDDAMVPLTKTDLMRGRLQCPARVEAIGTVDLEVGDEEETTDEIPPDFRLTISTPEGQTAIDAEAVILAVGRGNSIEFGFETPAPYFFRLGVPPTDNAENDLRGALGQIVAIFAGLAGRAELDLYRPRRN